VKKKTALNAYNKLIKQSETVFFEKKIQNTEECSFELGIVSTKRESDTPTYFRDDLGRSQRVYINNEDSLSFIEIRPYKVEEKLFDVKQNKKITLSEFDKKYLSAPGLKVISVLNHKVVLQNEDKFYLFSLKDEVEALRFLDSLGNYMLHFGNKSVMILKSTSLVQKKYLYDLLTEKGFDISVLYRKVTT